MLLIALLLIMNEILPANTPLVSIVLLNWNGEAYVHRCLEHVLAQSYSSIEVIVVDNASTDGSLEKIRAAHPELTFIYNASNKGFAVGMNQGIAASKGEYVVLLNQDVCLHRDFVKRCVSRIVAEDGLGAIGGRVFSWIGNELTEKLRNCEGELTFLRKRIQGRGGIRSDTEAYVFMPSGSFPFVSRAMLEDIKSVSGCYYDEDYETGWEDMDLFFRMQLRGWRCVFLPQASGWHVGSGSVGGKDTFLSKSIDYQVRIIRNRHFMIVKNLPSDILAWLFPYLVAAELSIPPYLLLKSPKSLCAWASAWKKTILSLPKLLVKRRLIQNNIRIKTNSLRQLFYGF